MKYAVTCKLAEKSKPIKLIVKAENEELAKNKTFEGYGVSEIISVMVVEKYKAKSIYLDHGWNGRGSIEKSSGRRQRQRKHFG